ncbi:MAG: hypothetical protein HY912_13220 [Desulfomonile tiedjei]|uniref:Fibronectin type-III domain-containing protein n=1 Tax=Desulfomonile tiedjei TaxID=2358 RepID=A0A9D6V7H1_9BACT|nr:hypothetical protein [Desulfomonile tiedjei]
MRGTGSAFTFIIVISCLVAGCGYKTNPRPAAATLPGEVGPVDAFAYPDRIVLRWDVPLANTDGSAFKDISGFKVFRAMRKIGEECEKCEYDRKPHANVDFQRATNAEIAEGKVLYTDKDINSGNAYTYSVNVYNLRGRESRPSADVTVAFDDPPKSPENLYADIAAGGIVLEWTTPAEKEGIQGYRVYRGSTGNPEEMKPIGTTRADEASFVDKTVEKEKTYHYMVRSVKMNNFISMESRPSSIVRVIVPVEHTDPPANVKAEAMPGGMRVHWDRAAIPGKEVRYNVYRSEGNKPTEKINTEPVRESWLVDRKIRKGMTYGYAVTAFPEGKPDYESSRSVTPAVRYNP